MIFRSRIEEILYCKKNGIPYKKDIYSVMEKMLNELELRSDGQDVKIEEVFNGSANVVDTEYMLTKEISDGTLLIVNVIQDGTYGYSRAHMIVKLNKRFFLFTNKSNMMEITFTNNSFIVNSCNTSAININKIIEVS